MTRRKSFLERMWDGSTQQARDQREREQRNVQDHLRRHAQRRAHLERASAVRQQASADQEQTNARLAADLRDQHESLQFHLRRLTDVLHDREQELDTDPGVMAAALQHGGQAAFTRAVQDDLSASTYPPCLSTRTTVLAYRPETRELVIERELPRTSVIPPELEYRIVKGTIVPVPRAATEVRHLYTQLLARIALRTAAEAFALTPSALVDSVVLNGWVTAVDHASGRTVHPHLVSVRFGRAHFEQLNLDTPELDPELCLRRNNAVLSPHPYDLVPVQPLADPGLERPRIVPDADRLIEVTNRLDLLTLSPTVFANLVRQLFEARGLRAWQTQASRDDGVDAVAVNEDPVLGGVAVIQAMRHSRVVPTEAIRALAGAMVASRAVRGILVTTSWVGRDSLEFARHNGRIQIIEGRELKRMLAESLHLDVLISLPTLPQGWDRTQVA